MTDFLLELRSEEIPARMQAKARADLAHLFAAELERAGLKASALVSYATPRRLALIARDLPLETAAVSEEIKGPRTSAPLQALEGFLRKTGLNHDQLEDRDGIWFAVVDKPGRKTADVLGEAIPQIVRSFPWPKAMRWGAASLSSESPRWVRPLQGIVALLGEDVVAFEVANVASGSVTLGHRFHHSGSITIGSAGDYVEKLRACHVIVDQDERAAMIDGAATRLAADAGLDLIEDAGLVAENAGLTEWPVPLLGRFNEAFLSVPPEVIQLTARVNQKYFVCRTKGGALANAFVCVANIAASDDGERIVEGNRKVLAARLADAKFFYETDLKTRLEDQVSRLEKIVFHEKLGTVADKTERVANLARWLAERGVVGEADPIQAERASRLAKADLVTGMVGEFPELQGLMGGYYAAQQGEHTAVVEAIRDHYKPLGQGDNVPTAPLTVAVSLADKLDTLVAFFYANLLPTGSKDPFALRRAAIGVIEMVTQNKLRLGLSEAITKGLAGLKRQMISATSSQEEVASHERAVAGVLEKLPVFFADRLKVQQREAGVRHDLIDAVFALGSEDELVRLLARVRALQAFITTEDGANLLAGYRRAANILKKEGWYDQPGAVRGSGHPPEPAEAALIAALDAAAPAAGDAVAHEDFEAAMAALATLRAPIDAFFDAVTVNDADPAKRAARLALLARIRDAVHGVADFSKIEG